MVKKSSSNAATTAAGGHVASFSTENTISQISIYSLSSMFHVKTLTYPSANTLNQVVPENKTTPTHKQKFASSTFCGGDGNKLLAALTEAPDREIIIWYWEKEKVYKSMTIDVRVNLLRTAPTNTLMLTVSGQGFMKYCAIAGDAQLKSGPFLQPTKENSENFVDHMWLPSQPPWHRMIVLADAEAIGEISTIPSMKSMQLRKQNIYIFEGADTAAKTVSVVKSQVAAPIGMELKQTISMKLEFGARLEKIVCTAKAFLCVGSQGLLSFYERSDDKHEPYVESKRITIGDINFVGGTVFPSEEKVILQADNGRLLSMNMDISVEQLKMSKTQLFEDDENPNNGVADEGSMHSSIEDAVSLLSNRANHSGGGISDLTVGGFHTSSVVAADLAYERPLLITVANDNTARIWNYQTQKCELYHFFRSDEPLSVAISATGFQILVSFKDRIRLYNILMNKLKFCKETVLKNTKCIKFSHGSQYWAAASGISVVIYESKSFAQLQIYQGHMMSVTRLIWAVGDEVVFSAGSDGNVYGWPIANNGRIEVVASSGGRSPPIIDICVDSPSTAFITAAEDEVEDEQSRGPPSNGPENKSTLIVSTVDGFLRLPTWSLDTSKSSKKRANDEGNFHIPGDPECTITAMALSSCRTQLYVGTSAGAIRVYSWPPVPVPGEPKSAAPSSNITPKALTIHKAKAGVDMMAQYTEVFTHSRAVTSIHINPLGNTLVSVAVDGSIFVHSLIQLNNKADMSANLLDPFGETTDAITLNTEVVMMSLEDIEDHVHTVVNLQKNLKEMRTKSEFQSRKLELDHTDNIRKMNEMHEATLSKEKDLTEKQRSTFEKRTREMMGVLEGKDMDHIKIVTELENKYEHKLADQLERYDRLSEKMQLLKQKCEGLLEAEKNSFNQQIFDVKEEARNREKKLKIENRRAQEDKIANESAFKEIIGQQEDEYEDELRQLIGAAEGELSSERETILKLRSLVQTKNTKLDQLKKKMLELSSASKARMKLLIHEKEEKQKLYETIEHYKKNLIEREDALVEKEKTVIELRSTTRTLENFRFVLDHRLQQLSSERGPITAHIEGLEKHVSTMYEELVEEFNNKKILDEAVQAKDQKIVWATQDLRKVRAMVREQEQYVNAFKREVSNIVTSMVTGKELEESVRGLYKKFVKGENTGNSFGKQSPFIMEAVGEIIHPQIDDDQSLASDESVGVRYGKRLGKSVVKEVEEALLETAKEAERQKRFVEHQSGNLKHRLGSLKRETHTMAKQRLNENSNLLFECNDLRLENRELHRRLEMNKESQTVDRNKIISLTAELVGAKDNARSAVLETRSVIKAAAQEQAAKPGGAHASKSRWVVHNSLAQRKMLGSPGKEAALTLGDGLPPRNDGDKCGLKSPTSHGMHSNHLSASASAPVLNRGQSAGAGRESTNSLPVAQSSPARRTTTPGRPIAVDALVPRVAAGGALMQNGSSGAISAAAAKKARSSSAQSARTGHEVGGKQALGGQTQAMHVAQVQIDKLGKEVDSLAQQLDNTQRDRDLQHREVQRLRNQLMAMVNGNKFNLSASMTDIS